MSLHEMVHAFVADWLGDDTARRMGRVSLNPIAHMDPIMTVALPLILLLAGSPMLFGAAKPVQVNFNRLKFDEFGGAIVGISGPLTNLLIAAVAAFIFNGIQPNMYDPVGWTYNILKITIELNVGLFVFNSIPWPPLDGSRVLYAFAPEALQELMRRVESFGFQGLIVLILLFYMLGSPIAHIIGSLIHFLAPTLII